MIKVGDFISATKEFNTFEKNIPAPYIRKSFVSDTDTKGKLTIAVCGFYELYINGKRCTKGFLSPFISNPEHYIYCDEYEIEVEKGENVIGILLGNGFQNNPGGYIWDFDKSSFRSAPMAAISVEYKNGSGEEIIIKSDESFKTFPSPIRSDDYRFGEIYDANFVTEDWNKKGFDDSAWENVIKVSPPCGELKLCNAAPIVEDEEIKPVKVWKNNDSYIYDFGVSHAGVCRMCIKGEKGQKIELRHADRIKDGEVDLRNIWFEDRWEEHKDILHKDTYICKGEGEEIYTPTFTYHGFRYVQVDGITEEQATADLLTFVTFHTKLETCGNFECSNQTINKLQEMTRRSDISNFHHFPTDCPQREKNGWTADAALSTEQMLLNFNPEKNYREWLCNICKAQNEEGALPGIVPTGGWGYHWGNGPAWDCVLVYLPYFVYIYRGETDMIFEAADSFEKYLKYLLTRKDEKGLMHIGLGDWCQVNGVEPPTSPLDVTDSIMTKDIADKMAVLFDAVGMSERRDFALEVSNQFKNAVREHLIDFETMTVSGNCQTSQAMAIFYDIFEEAEKEKAFLKLLELVHDADDHIDVGVLGGRVLFHVLTEFGYSDLAFEMIARPDYPSYGNWIERGATTLWENFMPDRVSSMNHHFWGDISAWFIKCIAGIRLNPSKNDVSKLEIRPGFIGSLNEAKAYHIAPLGKIVSEWKKDGEKIVLNLEIPDGMSAKAKLEKGFSFDDGTSEKEVVTGKYEIIINN